MLQWKILSTKTKLQFIISYSKNTTNFDAFHQAQKPYEIVGYAVKAYSFSLPPKISAIKGPGV